MNRVFKGKVSVIGRFLTACSIAFLLSASWSGSLLAETRVGTNTSSEESITSFRSDISVNLDNSIDVVESIVYNSGPQDRHGIYRDIYPYSSEGRKMNISVSDITDQNGVPYKYQKISQGSNIRLKIGDPKTTFVGEREYVIRYRATSAVGHPESVDEIYWNATGNGWNIPIYQAEAHVTLPKALSPVQSSCYYGAKGSRARCDKPGQVSGDFVWQSTLEPGYGLTVAVGFPKGIIPAYDPSAQDDFPKTDQDERSASFIVWSILIAFPFLTLIIMFIRWWKVGRDPKGRGVIVPQYDVPEGLTPFEVGCIVNQKNNQNDISAELVYLATQGYLKIRHIDNKVLGFIKVTDYEFELLKDYSVLPAVSDRNLLEGIFGEEAAVGAKKSLSKLRNSFYSKIAGIYDGVVEAVLNKGYYSNLKKKSSQNLGLTIAMVLIYFLLHIFVVVFAEFGSTLASIGFGAIILDGVVSVAIVIFFQKIMPAKTEKGVATKEYILGLKRYLQIAEKDRMEFHNAPAKRPEIFEKLLPYAMVLGVNEAWAKEFEGIYNQPPGWYEDYPITGHFSVIAFNHSISSFGSAASSGLSSSPGGSGGGGFSGGGGGGGGGGGW